MTTGIEMTVSELVLVDSTGWLEYITGDENADAFGTIFQGGARSWSPQSFSMRFLRFCFFGRQDEANVFLSQALRRTVVDLTETIALAAASLSIDYKLPMQTQLSTRQLGPTRRSLSRRTRIFRTSGRHADLVTDWIQFRITGNSSAAP